MFSYGIQIFTCPEREVHSAQNSGSQSGISGIYGVFMGQIMSNAHLQTLNREPNQVKLNLFTFVHVP